MRFKSLCLGAIVFSFATAPLMAQGADVSYSGTVIEYAPGKTIVIRDANDKLVTYTLAPDVVIPADVQVGRTVTYYTDPSGTGTVVRKVTTTSVTGEGDVKTTTQSTKTMPDGSTQTTTGTVVEYVPMKSIVVRDANNKLVTYLLPPELILAADVKVGRKVTLYTEGSGSGAAVRKVTTTTSITDAGNVKTTTESSKVMPDGSVLTSRGTVVEYVPRKRVVIRDENNKLVTYPLRRAATLSDDVGVGKTVTIESKLSKGVASVSRVTTTVITPEGEQKVTTRTTETSPEGTSTTTTETSVEGVISGYLATKTVTVKHPDGTNVTYELDSSSTIPDDLIIGRRVMLRSFPNGQQRVVRNITYTTSTVN